MNGPSVRPIDDVGREEGVVVDVQEEALELEDQEARRQKARRKPEEPTQEEPGSIIWTMPITGSGVRIASKEKE